ncbi:MAG: putative toxin-antitoxin system toxin component, PIN family [Limisphaerales bacterium]
MTVCIDTNALVQLFGLRQPHRAIVEDLLQGRLRLAVSTAILLEYEETITRLSGPARWQQIESFLGTLQRLHSNIIFVEPSFRFAAIPADPDDNKFADCAIAAQADYIVTEDRHFDALAGAGFRVKPVTPAQLAALLAVRS